jgi:hypothetical protein
MASILQTIAGCGAGLDDPVLAGPGLPAGGRRRAAAAAIVSFIANHPRQSGPLSDVYGTYVSLLNEMVLQSANSGRKCIKILGHATL